MGELILVYYCYNLHGPQGRMSCLMRFGDKIKLLYCVDKQCHQECGIPDYLACSCYSRSGKEDCDETSNTTPFERVTHVLSPLQDYAKSICKGVLTSVGKNCSSVNILMTKKARADAIFCPLLLFCECSSVVRALPSQGRSRELESLHSHQINFTPSQVFFYDLYY